jgi:hypothetical protein
MWRTPPQYPNLDHNKEEEECDVDDNGVDEFPCHPKMMMMMRDLRTSNDNEEEEKEC